MGAVRCTWSGYGGDDRILGLSSSNHHRPEAQEPAKDPLGDPVLVRACEAGKGLLATLPLPYPLKEELCGWE